jgi:hypothetical protein
MYGSGALIFSIIVIGTMTQPAKQTVPEQYTTPGGVPMPQELK